MPQIATFMPPMIPTPPAIPTATTTASSVEICPTCGTRRIRRTRRPYTPQPGDSALRVLRLRAGLSQVQLANLIGVYQPYIALWEHAEHARYVGLTAQRVQALAAALGVSATEVREAIRHLVWPLP